MGPWRGDQSESLPAQVARASGALGALRAPSSRSGKGGNARFCQVPPIAIGPTQPPPLMCARPNNTHASAGGSTLPKTNPYKTNP